MKTAAPERLFPKQPWESTPGLEVAPVCVSCGSGTVWRGRWECQGCSARGAWLMEHVGPTPPALPREALAGVPIFSSSEGNNSTDEAARAQWLWAVESLTSFHRASVAASLLRKGTRTSTVEDFAVDEETGEILNRQSGGSAGPHVRQWHQQRIKGQAERFERVAACGTFNNALEITADDGTVRTQPIRTRCDCWRVCYRCAQRRKWLRTEGTKAQRELAFRVFRSQTSRWYRGPEGKWSEKLISFTVPHSEHGPAHDARAIVGAWQKVLRVLRRHLVERGAYTVSESGKKSAVSIPWSRTLEVATRNNEHAHMHVWYVGPFIDVALLGYWWGRILEAEGVSGLHYVRLGELRGKGRDRRLRQWTGNREDGELVPRGIVDITSDKGDSEALGAYTAKMGIALYTTKGSEILSLAPAHAASIYEVFEGIRAVQWARGWAPKKEPMRARCITFRRLTDEEKKRLNQAGAGRPRRAGTVVADSGGGSVDGTVGDTIDSGAVSVDIECGNRLGKMSSQITMEWIL